MDHLDVVTSTLGADPVAARLAVRLGGGLLEDLLDVRPRLGVATGHERRAVTGTLLTTGDTRTYEKETFFLKFFGTADRVWVVGVTTIDDDVTRLEMGDELANEVIDSRAGLDEKNDFTRSLEFFAELLYRECTDDVGACLRFIINDPRLTPVTN